MYLARCLHPPGGATALAAVIGSEQLHQLGFNYILQPILLNVVVILLVAVLFNALFYWRRYPVRLQAPAEPDTDSHILGYEPINHEDFVYALSQIDTIVDVSEEDLLKIYQLAMRRHVETSEQDPET
jgi:CBS-domain-containing membrane protein